MKRIVIVGAGMAGASLAAALAGAARVVLIEAESQPGYHATGRSAAFWSESYGGPLIQPLTTSSRLALDPFLKARGAIHLADSRGAEALRALAVAFPGVALDAMDRPALDAAIPGLRAGWDHGLAEPSCADIDVASLHAHCLAQARVGGATLMTATKFSAAQRGECWRIETSAGTIEADILVNAGGAWADEIAVLAEQAPLDIRPYRRTMVQLRVDPPVPAGLPLIIDAGGRFYFKPEAGGRIWLSPHDETPAVPCDCAPEEIDVALAIDRLQRVVDWRVVGVERKWAGLRSFAPDRLPVYGFGPKDDGFFWFAGQGGFGIQTAPAAAALAAALIRGDRPELDPSPYAPGRFAK